MPVNKQVKEVHKHTHNALNRVNQSIRQVTLLSKALDHVISHTESTQQGASHHVSKRFAKKTVPLIHDAIENVSDLGFHIDTLEDHYQNLLSLSDLDLETHVRVEHKMRGHIISLRGLHDSHKETVQRLGKMFVHSTRRHALKK